jgi:hypothetical protein
MKITGDKETFLKADKSLLEKSLNRSNESVNRSYEEFKEEHRVKIVELESMVKQADKYLDAPIDTRLILADNDTRNSSSKKPKLLPQIKKSRLYSLEKQRKMEMREQQRRRVI